MRATRAPEMLRQARERHSNSGLSDQQWDDFLLVYKGDVDEGLASYIKWADGEVRKLNGIAPPLGDPNVPLIDGATDLSKLPLGMV